MNIKLEINDSQVAAVQQRLGKLRDLTPKAISTAINKVLPAVRTQIKLAAKKEVVLPSNQILHLMKIVKASPNNISGRIYIHRRKVDVMQLRPKQTKRGVAIKYRTSGPTNVEHGFIATMPKTGHKGVFVRRTPGHREKREKGGKRYTTQLPIDEIRVPSVAEVLTEKPDTLRNIRADAQNKLDSALNSQVDWLIARNEVRG